MILSIIIPIYNVEPFIEKCILSCLRQDISENMYEIICVNDGSLDNSATIARKIASEHPNVKVIDQKNGGLSSARNTGMRYAIGDYYMFLDSDDWIAENCLGKIKSKLEDETPDVLGICAAYVINGKSERCHSYPEETPIKGKNLLKRGVSPCAPFAIWSSLFLKENGLLFYEGIFHEDTEFTPRAYYLADKVSFINEIIYYYYKRPNSDSITTCVNSKRSFDLVEVVCVHLSDFVKNVEDDYKMTFYDMVGQYLNNAMAFILPASIQKQRELENTIIKHRYLWRDMEKSSIVKYRLEAKLFSIFPNHPLRVYKTLQLINLLVSKKDVNEIR